MYVHHSSIIMNILKNGHGLILLIGYRASRIEHVEMRKLKKYRHGAINTFHKFNIKYYINFKRTKQNY